MKDVDIKRCEVCNAPMYEGELGEAWWICSNKKCSRSNHYWPTKELMSKIQPEYDQLQNKIDSLRELIIIKINAEVTLHSARWIGDGSGIIKIHDKNIEFYFENNEVKYLTNSKELCTLFEEHRLDEYLFKLWNLSRNQFSLFH